MKLGNIFKRAKREVDKRGGVDALRQADGRQQARAAVGVGPGRL